MAASSSTAVSPLKGRKRPGLHPSQAWFNGTIRARKARKVKPAEIKAFTEAMVAKHAHLKAPTAADLKAK